MAHFVCCPVVKDTLLSVQEYSGKLPYAEHSDPSHQHFKTFAGLHNRHFRQDTAGTYLEAHFQHFVCCPEMKGTLYSVQDCFDKLPYPKDSDPFHQHFKTFAGLHNRHFRQETAGTSLEAHFQHFVCCPEMKGTLYSVQDYSGKLPYPEDSDPFHQHFKTFAGLHNRHFGQDIP